MELKIFVLILAATAINAAPQTEKKELLSTDPTVITTGLRTDACEPGNCTENKECHYNQPSGCIYIPSDRKWTYWIDVRNNTSVVRLHLLPCNDTTGNGIDTKVTISEPDNIVHTWIIDEAHADREFRYLSQFPSIRIDVDSGAAKTQCKMLLNYEEVKFEYYVVTDDSDSGQISSHNMNDSFFRPNTARVYRLVPEPDSWSNSSVSVTVMSLDLESGDYVLIGAGNETFSGPRAAHLKGKITKPMQYHIANDHAYIVFYRASSDRRFTVDIKWIRTGEQITKPDEDTTDKTVTDTTLQAVPVCFYNASWIIEFNQTSEETGMFYKFQTKFADIANRYVKEKGIKYVQEIRAESVQLIQISSVFPPDDETENLENGALYTIIGIVQPFDSKMSVFKWHEMKAILERFDAYDEGNHHELLGFKVGKCPENNNYKSWFYATALVVIICAALFITVWLCSINTTWRSHRYRNSMKKLQRKLPRLPSQRKHVSNDYVAYENQGFEPPKISLKNDLVTDVTSHIKPKKNEKRYFSIHSDDESDEEVFTKNWIMKNRSSIRDLPTDTAFDMKMARMHQMHMFDIPLHEDQSSSSTQPKRRSTKTETEEKGSSTSNQYIFGNIFDEDDSFEFGDGTKL